MIVLFGCEKGGAGKTTLATNIAATCINQGVDVLLVDTDTQASASDWAAMRDENPATKKISSIKKTGEVHQEIFRLSSRFENIIVDAGGKDSRELRSATLVANYWFIPVQPSQYDLWTMEKMDQMVNDAQLLNPNLKAYAIINRATTNPFIREIDEVKEALASLQHIKVWPVTIYERVVFRKTPKIGLGVTEFEPKDQKAIDEIMSIFKEVWQ